jgi:SAM-dependent methyltransferase
MLPLNSIEWQKVLSRLDDLLATAAERYVRSRGLNGDDLARGDAMLDGTLGAGAEPNYADPAVVGAYAFKYLARRVTSLFGALTLMHESTPPSRVLDIASGSDATAIALSLRFPGARIAVQAVEPSEEMRALGEQFSLGPGITVNRRAGTFSDIVSGTTDLMADSFDLIVMSTGFPYDTNWKDAVWSDLVARIADAAGPNSSVVVIEPQAKARILVGSEISLRATERFRTQQWCCHDMPEPIRQAEVLRRSTMTLQRYHPEGLPVQTWNPVRREYVIVGREGAIAARHARPA